MERSSFTTYGLMALLGVGSVVIVNFWVGAQINEPIPVAAPVAIAQPLKAESKKKGPVTTPPIDENGMLVPIGTPIAVQPDPKAAPAAPLKKIYEGPLDNPTGDLAG